ncbi:hypothetical protein DFJ74DRAFT_661823 [Hyaloraphidium curvatum]|nr:hypothetical protein DFJ74DRAFT_661823 [Hyaloraphidium curvatum]
MPASTSTFSTRTRPMTPFMTWRRSTRRRWLSPTSTRCRSRFRLSAFCTPCYPGSFMPGFSLSRPLSVHLARAHRKIPRGVPAACIVPARLFLPLLPGKVRPPPPHAALQSLLHPGHRRTPPNPRRADRWHWQWPFRGPGGADDRVRRLPLSLPYLAAPLMGLAPLRRRHPDLERAVAHPRGPGASHLPCGGRLRASV